MQPAVKTEYSTTKRKPSFSVVLSTNDLNGKIKSSLREKKKETVSNKDRKKDRYNNDFSSFLICPERESECVNLIYTYI